MSDLKQSMQVPVESYHHTQGRLFAVGDLHGCYDLLMEKLNQLQFDFQNDLLIAVGDLVDRGPDSVKCLKLLEQPWFKAILGNHEEMCLQSHTDPSMANLHAQHGGKWFYQLSFDEQRQIIAQLQKLPVLLEVVFQSKKYGFVHADIDLNDWEQFKTLARSKTREIALWGRGRIRSRGFFRYSKVRGVDTIFLGHTIVDSVTKKQNCYYIDTGAYLVDELTVVEINQHITIEKQVNVI